MARSLKNFLRLLLKQSVMKSEIFKRYTWLKNYRWIFKTFRIDICNDMENKKCSVLISLIFIKMIWGIILYVSFAKLYASFPIVSSSSRIALLFKPTLICSFLIWYYIFKLHCKINKSVRKLQNLADFLKVSPSRQFERIPLMYFVLTYVFRIYAEIPQHNETRIKNFIQELSFRALDIQSIDGRIETGIWISFELIQSHFVYASPDFVCMFFITVNNQMTRILNNHIIKSKNIINRGYITSKEFESLWRYYNAVISIFNTMNEIWSIPNFLTCTYYSTIILFDSLLMMIPLLLWLLLLLMRLIK